MQYIYMDNINYSDRTANHNKKGFMLSIRYLYYFIFCDFSNSVTYLDRLK